LKINAYIYIISLSGNFIELNSFGKQYASGSALFGWIQDYNILYGLCGDVIEFRYTI
jgi:hypothetical protein